MKAKRKIGMSCKGKRKRITKNNSMLTAKKKRTSKKKNSGKRLIPIPGQSGGVVPLIPIFAGLSALGSLMSGGASVYNAIQNSKSKKGNGLYLNNNGLTKKKIIIMITLPDRPLSTQDIIKYVRKLKINHFRGVFSRDSLPKKPHVIECGLLNLDISSGDGSHWVAFHKNKDKVIYFDSFGDLPPPIELQRYFKKFKISTVLTENYFPSLNVYEDSEIALLSLQTFNSFPNIINTINNRLKIEVIPSKRNKYKLHTFEFCLEEGCYEIEDINNKIAKELSQVNNNYGTQLTFSVRIDPVDFKTYIKCNGILQSNTPYSIAPVFGFKKIRCGPFHEARRSDKAVNLNTINSIKVLCNIAHGSFNNQLQIDDENNNTPMMCYIKLEEGCYEIEDINQRIKKQIDDYNSENLTKLTFDISVDPNDFRSYIKCNGILHFEIPFSMAPLFGFDKRQYKPEYAIHRSEKAVNLNTINSIKVMCNIAQGSFNNHLQSHSIYEFFPSERTGSKLVDQDHNPIDNFGEALTIVLHIKRYGS
ncbi:hypothetical protein AGLY_016866 [Aphis glycines]|uniref:Uncharacterized protein n=2 Tax=Aphis TaxID=464929 RepID=A0A6G0SYM3_APHGL|nr:hypothetical protein AGLY_016866 [Aphis glycines]